MNRFERVGELLIRLSFGVLCACAVGYMVAAVLHPTADGRTVYGVMAGSFAVMATVVRCGAMLCEGNLK